MKKVFYILTLALLLCGCGSKKESTIIKDFQNKMNGLKTYKVIGSMEISNDEESFTYSLEGYYLKDNYYKVVLVNETNNHEQIILRNNDEVYVITPDLNKSFKFESTWPNNSSQAYLLGNLANDLKNDSEATIVENDNEYIIKTKVNYPNNGELVYEKIYLNSDLLPTKVEVYNSNDIVRIKVVFEDVDLKPGLKGKDFQIDNYIKEEEPKKEETQCSEGEECQEEKKTANIENIIYPLYIPSETYLASSETVETEMGNRVILTFNGEKDFVLIEEMALASTEMEIIPVYGEPLMLTESIGALSANSLSWQAGNISYYLASTDLDTSEMILIANSLGNTTLVANTK